MEGDHQCPTHKTRCVERQEENYFFALSKYQQQIQVPLRTSCMSENQEDGSVSKYLTGTTFACAAGTMASSAVNSMVLE